MFVNKFYSCFRLSVDFPPFVDISDVERVENIQIVYQNGAFQIRDQDSGESLHLPKPPPDLVLPMSSPQRMALNTYIQNAENFPHLDLLPFNFQLTFRSEPLPSTSTGVTSTYTPMSANYPVPRIKIEENSDSDSDCDIKSPKRRNRKRINSEDLDLNNVKKTKFTPKATNIMSHSTTQCFNLLGARQRFLITDNYCLVSITPADRKLADSAFKEIKRFPHFRTINVQQDQG